MHNINKVQKLSVRETIVPTHEYTKEDHPPFGWLLPSGEFIELKWGDHVKTAPSYVEDRGWLEEFNQWNDSQEANRNQSDFLCQVKGWVMLHSPQLKNYIITGYKALTKRQADYLYDLFFNLGEYEIANKYLDEY